MTSHDGFGQVSVIVPAAGAGTRMGTKKQYLPVNNKPILQHTLERLSEMQVRQIVLVVAPDDQDFRKVPGHEACEIVTGGDTRGESVRNALRHLKLEDADWVMVHDAARPCVRVAEIERLVAAVDDSEVGGLLAVPVIDTIKRVQESKVIATLDRQGLWLAQTPQMFRYGVLRRAMEKALAADIAVTDEASAVEYLGLVPIVVEGRRDNIKVTTRADLALAAWYLEQQIGEQPDQVHGLQNKQQDQR